MKKMLVLALCLSLGSVAFAETVGTQTADAERSCCNKCSNKCCTTCGTCQTCGCCNRQAVQTAAAVVAAAAVEESADADCNCKPGAKPKP